MLRSLPLLLAVVLVGCAAPASISLDASHPAYASAAVTPHAAASDALPEAVAVYAPSGVRAHHDHAGHAHAAGHDHAPEGCLMGCCEGDCDMPCCNGEGHAHHNHGHHDLGSHDGPCCDGETCRMDCCEDCAACCESGACCEHGCEGHGDGMTCEHGAEGRSASCCDHGTHDHGTHGEGHSCAKCDRSGETTSEAVDFTRSPAPTTSLDSAALDQAVDHYLAISEALGNDAMAGVRESASALAELLDDDALHAEAEALAAASNVMQAREAFGRLSPGFAALAEGSDRALTRYVCGMADAPESGVWLQAEGTAPRNPYFGAAMLACHRDATSL